MESLIVLIFVVGYVAITLEHSLKIDKLIPALIMMAFCWALISVGYENIQSWFDISSYKLVEGFGGMLGDEKQHLVKESLLHYLGKTAEILIFLIGAMTIVEIIDYFDGFNSIKRAVKTDSKKKLLWIFSFLAFFLSAIIDNLTATIILVSILQKIILESKDRVWFASIIIIAANAGGTWSPIGDVTTTMLWIGNKVSTQQLISYLLIPSLLCMVVATTIASFLPAFQGRIAQPKRNEEQKTTNPYSSKMLYLGLGSIAFVPIFKVVTHLPPYVGMMLSLGVVALFAEIYSRTRISLTAANGKESKQHAQYSPIYHSLSRIEMPSVLFFLGILMAVAALESVGILFGLADWLKVSIPFLGVEPSGSTVSDLVILLLGVASAVIDNVPLVAASLGMFSEATDSPLWHFIAYTAGTGGSMLIIGSAAGVVAMGMEKINFFWYLKKIAWIALVSFAVGAFAFILLRILVFS